MKGRLLHTILKGAWLMDANLASGYLPFVTRLMSGDGEPASFYEDREDDDTNAGYYVFEDKGVIRASYDLKPKGSVAVHQYRGVVLKDDQECGPQGTASVLAAIKAADADDNIGAHVLIIDSGGGAVDGTFDFSSQLSGLTKPVIGYVDELAASAGYAMLANSSKIYASSEAATIGSIGVMCTIHDFTGYLKAQGVEEIIINSTTNPDKNDLTLKAKAGDTKPMAEHMAKIHAIFKSTVKNGRPNVSEAALTGKVYLANEAIDMGLVDGIATLEDVINEALDIAKKID